MASWVERDPQTGALVLKDDLLNQCLGRDHRAAHCLNYPGCGCFSSRQGSPFALPGVYGGGVATDPASDKFG